MSRRLLFEAARRFDLSEDDTLALQLDYLEVVFHKPVLLKRPGWWRRRGPTSGRRAKDAAP